ncbi:MAG: nucleotide exchange factor GrpE [Chloroflexota bacterium]
MTGESQQDERPERGGEAPVAEPQSVEALQQALTDERAKAEQYLASWQRAQADFINYRRRTEQERCAFTAQANADLILKILPVIDDIERAFQALPPSPEEPAWVEGFRLVQHKLKTVLTNHGLEEIKAVGEPFDPRFHEAIAYEDGGDEGVVVHETQTGYKLCDRVLRPSLVVVGKGKTTRRHDERNRGRNPCDPGHKEEE